MKTYNIPITWQSVKTYEVQANSLQEAAKKALQEFFTENDPNYIEDSYDIDSIIEDDYPSESIDFTKL